MSKSPTASKGEDVKVLLRNKRARHDYFVEQSMEAARLIPNAQLAVIPGASHFVLSSDPEKLLPVVAAFLEEPATDIPLASVRDGYHPGVNR